MAFTIIRTIGTGQQFSTPQLWEDGAAANYTTAEKSPAGTFVGTFVQGETLSFVGSGAAGKFLDSDQSSYVSYGLTSGNPATSDVVTGATSGATAILSSGTPTATGLVWRGEQLNEEIAQANAILVFNGATTSSTAYPFLTTQAGASFRDNANVQTNALRYNTSNGAGYRTTGNAQDCVTISDDNVDISNMQLKQDGTGALALDVFGGASGEYEFLICEGSYTGTSVAIGVCSMRGTLMNSLFILRASAADHVVTSNTASPNVYNCTIAAPDDLATAPTRVIHSGASGTCNCQNCGLFAGDSTKAIKGGSATFTFTTCYSDISGTTGVTQCTYSNQFQNVNNATRDYRLKAGADMIDNGTTDSTHAAIDIAGTARPQGPAYDVGCWELVQTSGVRLLNEGILIGGRVHESRLAQ